MNKDKKRKVISTFTTIAVHLLLLIILMFVTLKVAKPDTFEDGVPVLLGNVEDATGPDLNSLPAEQEETDLPEPESQPEEVEEVPAPPQPEDVKPQPAKPTPPPAPQITQTQERSIAAEEAKKKREEEAARKKAAEEAAKKAAAEEAARKRAAEEERRKKEKEKEEQERAHRTANNKVTEAFGNRGKQNNSGESNGEGHQGNPNGNSTTGQRTGSGGIGTSTSIKGREFYPFKVVGLGTESSGEIVVNVTVDRNGNVITASIKSNGTGNSSLNEIFRDAARKSKYSAGEGTVSGTIIYNIKPAAANQ